MPSKPNLLVLCVDCLREDCLASSASDTPFFDDFRASGLACEQLFATATTTTPAVASLLTGSYSERNGVHSLQHGRLDPEVPTLPGILAEHGWHTEALATGPLVAETGLDRGFDVYRHREEDESLFGDWRETAHDRLASLSEPFAAFVHCWELHEDIDVPAAYDEPAYGDTDYTRALSALDRELRDLVETLPENTLVAIHGDHGESITHRHNPLRLLGKSVRDAIRYYGGVDTRTVVGRLNRALDGLGPDIDDHFLENGHGENVFDFTTNVPFLLAGPGIDPATITAQTRQIDVLPTLLAALDIDVDAGTDAEMDGDALLPADDVTDRPAYIRACGASLHRTRNWARAIRHDGAKYIEYPDREWSAECYDLDADPQELASIEADRLAARLQRHLPTEELGDAERLDIDARLRDLGYL
ncbi:sulfatase-like hydrolase/transferase [Halococcus sp. PRR34]|uniref:sulfatase-like hydrolase/transferase n=1 Tax=Halococcus sp. PRR34 TaxID=3020830 RepID=UPI0023631363|nr:sulfatase-like hydrolase/transferase [Halococcus sp. PRR34]